MFDKGRTWCTSHLLSISMALENQIRGLLKTFGRIYQRALVGYSKRMFMLSSLTMPRSRQSSCHFVKRGK
jgi:transposase